MKVTSEMVDRFLAWQLPESVCADPIATKRGPGRIGTNLLTFNEAKQMLIHVLAQPAPSAASGLAERAIPFWQKHAMGSKLCPSCFACGNAEPDSSRWAIKHLELPDIYICATCMDRLRSHQAPVGEEDDRPDIPTLEQAREELAGISDSEWANYLEGLVRAHERRARSPQTGGGSNG